MDESAACRHSTAFCRNCWARDRGHSTIAPPDRKVSIIAAHDVDVVAALPALVTIFDTAANDLNFYEQHRLGTGRARRTLRRAACQELAGAPRKFIAFGELQPTRFGLEIE